MGGVEVVGFVCGGVFVVRVVVVGFVLAIAVAVVGGVIVVVLFRRLFGLNLLRRCSRSANSFCSRVWGVAVVLSGTYGGGVVDGDGVGGIAGHAHSDLVGVGVGVLIGDGVGGTAGSAQRVDVGVLSGVGDGGTAGSAHKLDVGVLSGVGEGGTAGSAHRVASRLDVSSGGGVAARHVVCALAGGGVCSFPSSASIASSKNLSSPLGCFVALQWPKPPKRTSGLCCGMKSASELHSSAALSVVELSSLSSLKSDFAAIARPWCFSQCSLAIVCLSLSLSGGVFGFFFGFTFARFGLYPGWKNVGVLVLAVVVVGTVEVVGVVVVVDTALAAALASAGRNVAAFAFHFIVTFGGLAGGLLLLVLVPLVRFLFLPFGEREREFAIVSQRAPFSVVAAAIRSSIVWCGGASMRRSPFFSSSSWTATAWWISRSCDCLSMIPSHRMRLCLIFETRS